MTYYRPTTPHELAEQRATLIRDASFWDTMQCLAAVHPELADTEVIRDGLTLASLWWVTAECCDLLAQTAPTMPPVTLDPDQIPGLDGFAFLERPIAGMDAWLPGGTVAFDAIHWQPSIVGGLGCLSIIMWRFDEPELPPVPLGRTDWPVGFDTDVAPSGVSPEAAPSMIEGRRHLAALWQLAARPEFGMIRDVSLGSDADKRSSSEGH